MPLLGLSFPVCKMGSLSPARTVLQSPVEGLSSEACIGIEAGAVEGTCPQVSGRSALNSSSPSDYSHGPGTVTLNLGSPTCEMGTRPASQGCGLDELMASQCLAHGLCP